MRRRDFIKTGVAAGSMARAQSRRIAIVAGANEAGAVRWAADELERALTESGHTVSRVDAVSRNADLSIISERVEGAPESVAISHSGAVLRAGGADLRGQVYALLELADRARHGSPLAAAVSESPLNPVRSISRMFVSDVEDKPWFYDREMWPAYLTMLATQRFNRFSLALSIGYDFLREVTDAYLLFPYPFLLTVPGFQVRATNVPDAERERNLETLKFITEQTAARGLEFQLGLWMHGYQWANSPRANHVIEGLTTETHAPYCRAALTKLLKACPAISGVTFRIHGESGVPEGSYAFWRTIFEGVRDCGRTVRLDLHTKGIDQEMIDGALATGLPVTVSPKFWAEHTGMPYHQADIRDQEIPHGRTATGLMALSTGERSFTRYGVADLLREDRRYDVVHRIWPGSQRMLLWGDPEWTAAYSRAFTFCGSKGVEIFEPLSFKGRRGSGIPGGRCGYADARLKPRWDWEKFSYTYRVWGRLLYNPEAGADQWRRWLRTQVGDGAAAAEGALAHASRILPTITTTHLPSAANNNYWPEMYTNQPMVHPGKNGYSDTPSPKVFGNVSPLDPQMFSRINDFADALLTRARGGKYSPIEVAQWLEDAARSARTLLGQADTLGGGKSGAGFRRLSTDVSIEAGLGEFFAAKFRAGVLYRIHERTGDRAALEAALRLYRSARGTWAEIAKTAEGVYVRDVTVGELPWLRGQWSDRLTAIDDDIADMEKLLGTAKISDDPRVGACIREALGRPTRPRGVILHTAVNRYRPGEPVSLSLSAESRLESGLLHYRRVNQAERWETVELTAAGDGYSAAIPGPYTQTEFPLQYYFELRSSSGAWLYPGFPANLGGQPYFVVRRAS